MPTTLLIGSFRFFFYSGDRDEPPHTHIERADKIAKIWLDPTRLQQSGGFNRREINHLLELVRENQKDLLRSWDEFFGR
jgi:hypothetical protein